MVTTAKLSAVLPI